MVSYMQLFCSYLALLNEGDILNVSHALITKPDRLAQSCWLVLNLQRNA